MEVYIYNAALYCKDCTNENWIVTLDPNPATGRGSSDKMPQGPYPDGGGEADTPQHCDTCGMFLENPLTEDGIEYVRRELDLPGTTVIRQMWKMFYANSL